MAKREQSKQEKALHRYFAHKKGRSVLGGFLLIVGAGFLYVASQSSSSEGALLLGVLLMFLGLLAIVIPKGSPSDQQVDRWLDEGIDRLIKGSQTKLNLGQLAASGERGPSAEPLLVLGPILWSTNGVADEDLVWRKGKDDMVRFGVYRVSVIHLTERHLAAYSCDYDFIRDVPLNEETEEFHYVDIVGVSTKEQASSLTLPSGVKLTSAQKFAVSVTSGETLEVFVDAAKLSKVTGSDKIPDTGAEKAVSVIRAMLRDKKRAYYPGAGPSLPPIPSTPRAPSPPAPLTSAPPAAVSPSASAEQVCPNCGARAEANAKFCMTCGKELRVGRRTCKRCGSELAPGTKFCGECGNKVG